MLSLFPEILFLSPLAPFAIRLALAALLVYAAWPHLSHPHPLQKTLSAIEVGIAATLLAGAWTQAIALVGLVYMSLGLALPRIRLYPISTILLAIVMFATLIVTGAGAIAFDLPL